MKKFILGAIVAYNPNIERLTENINNINKQVDKLLIIDNGSTNFQKIRSSFTKTKMIAFSKKMGIAKALRQVMIYSINNKYDWVLTLDQDSIPSKDLIRNYIRYIDTLKNIGAMTCIIKDRNFKNDEMVKMVIFVIL